MRDPIYAILIFSPLAVFLFVWAIADIADEAIRGARRTDDPGARKLLLRLLLPYVQMLGRAISRIGGLEGVRGDIDRKLTAAGKDDLLTADELMACMVLGGAGGAAVGLYFWFMLAGSIDQTFLGLGVPFAALVGFFLPFLGLGDAVKRRHAEIRRALPYSLDLLTLSVEAGLDFTASLSGIADRIRGDALKKELRRLIREIAMGKTRSEALRDMSDRVGLDDLKSVCSALIQADELGSSLGPILRIQGDELRQKRFQRAEKRAMQAPVLMLFPLIAFIFPLVFLVLFGPLVIRFLYDNPFG